MKRGPIAAAVLAVLVGALLSACGGAAAEPAAQPRPQAQATPQATVAPLPEAGEPTPAAMPELAFGVSGQGEVMANQDADLVFVVQGTVAEVLVQEGDQVTKDQVLARLDTRIFDQQLHQAEALLASAQAQKAGLTEEPRDFDARAARAQVAQAQAALAQLRAGPKSQDVQSLEAALNTAQANLQSTRDRLSLGKTQAESQMTQAVDLLTQAQARYSTAKTNWETVRDTGKDPIVPETVDPKSGEKVDNQPSDGSRQNYYNTFVQAEAAMHQAEEQVRLATIAYEQARQAEVVGIQIAEQQVSQAQAALDKLLLPADQDRIAAAQAGLAQAQANQARLTAEPRDSQNAQADAAIAQAQAGLELAQINREHAELRAPFDGVVDVLEIDPGDPSTTQGQPAIRVVDISALHVDAQISDMDIGRVQAGQQVSLYADALPGQLLAGKVSYIAPTAQVQGAIRTYLVRITLDEPQGLRVGMSVRVEIEAK
jgi:HlyD family secretion protein